MNRHRLLVAVFATMAMAGWSQDIIVESYADGENSQGFSTVEGRWTESTAKSTAPGLTATKSVFNDANTDPAVARFTPQIPETGEYEVFITYPPSGNASDIKYTVVSADGTKELAITQYGRDFGHTPQANQWSSIGTYTFNEGTSGYVEVADPLTGEKPMASEPNARIYADAVKFVPKGGAAATVEPDAVVSAESQQATIAMGQNGAATTPAAGTAAELPSLAAGTPAATPAQADMPGLSAVQDTATPAAMPGLPDSSGQANAAAQLPGLPSTPATDTAAGLPSLPGGTTPAPAASQMPGLPEATPAATAALPGLPDMSGATVATTRATVAETPAVTAQMTPYPVPNLPSLAPVTPTPVHMLPSPSDTPVPGSVASLPAGALSAMTPAVPALPTPAAQRATTTLPGTTTAGMSTDPAAGSPLGMGLPGTMQTPAVPTPPPPGTSISEYNPANLQWMYDFGAALNTARAQNKKVLVFFTAEGNRAAHTYETEYFTHPSVRQALNNYVLVKVDFPKNTRLGYSLGIFGAGIIVVADQTGDVTNRIEQLPPTPVDLVQQMASVNKGRGTTAAAGAAATGTGAGTAADAMTTAPR